MITYQLEPDLTPAEFVDLLVRATLAERRPVDRPDVIRAMLAHADVVLTARFEQQLVGVARAITDFSYCTYLSDLAVDQAHWRQGIGRELVRQTHETAGAQTHLILLAAPNARTYYPHIGMTPHDSAWIVRGRPPGTRSWRRSASVEVGIDLNPMESVMASTPIWRGAAGGSEE